MTPTVPTELQAERYTVTDKLGAGGMAVVHRAYDNHLGVWRAVKFLLQPMPWPDSTTKTSCVCTTSACKTMFMVMELAHGGSLEQWIELHGECQRGLPSTPCSRSPQGSPQRTKRAS